MAVVAEIKISLTDQGAIQVEGEAIQNKMLAYGMLEVAKESIYTHHQNLQRKVQPVTTADIANLRGLDGGRNN